MAAQVVVKAQTQAVVSNLVPVGQWKVAMTLPVPLTIDCVNDWQLSALTGL